MLTSYVFCLGIKDRLWVLLLSGSSLGVILIFSTFLNFMHLRRSLAHAQSRSYF